MSFGRRTPRKRGAPARILMSGGKSPAPPSSLSVTMIRSALSMAFGGSRRGPAGKRNPFPNGLARSARRILMSLATWRCWKPSSRIRMSAPKRSVACLPASARLAPVRTATPGHDLAINSGSSPAWAQPVRIRSPSDTTVTGDEELLPYPRLSTAGRYPFSRRTLASMTASGVFPVPPTVRLPTLMTGHPIFRCLRIPISNRPFLRKTADR